jgi:AraC family transcriptional regulator
MTEETSQDYISRINSVILYINNNLENEMTIDELASIANFSTFHFHRIFKAVTKESLYSYIQRLRLEKICCAILNHKDISFTQIAFTYGFNSSSNFSRAFKKRFGFTPSEMKKFSLGTNGLIQLFDDTNKIKLKTKKYKQNIDYYIDWINKNGTMSIQNFSKKRVAFVMNQGPYHKIKDAYTKLFKWANSKCLLNDKSSLVSIYYDNPHVTDESKLRQAASIVVDKSITASGEVGITDVEGGRFAVGRFNLSLCEFELAWEAMFVWLSESGYKFRDGDVHDINYSSPIEIANNIYIVDICIPIL